MISVVIATRSRPDVLVRTLASIKAQSHPPNELIVVDSSPEAIAQDQNERATMAIEAQGVKAIYRHTECSGAASQRNLGFQLSTQTYIFMLDDDVILDPSCTAYLLSSLENDPRLGAVTATITNQSYHQPSRFARVFFQFLDHRKCSNYAGRCIGPGLTQSPDAGSQMPVAPVEWLCGGCTLYRQSAIPSPAFPPLFEGASLCEDLYLSLEIAKNWDLGHSPKAKVFHDSQPGDHKQDVKDLARMELVNRYVFMRKQLGRHSVMDHVKFVAMMSYFYLSNAARQSPAISFRRLLGSFQGMMEASMMRQERFNC